MSRKYKLDDNMVFVISDKAYKRLIAPTPKPIYCETCRDACTKDEELHWNETLCLWLCDMCEEGKSRA